MRKLLEPNTFLILNCNQSQNFRCRNLYWVTFFHRESPKNYVSVVLLEIRSSNNIYRKLLFDNFVRDNKIELLQMYDFEGDYETVYTGQKLGLENIGLIEKYRGSTRIPQWDSPCGDVSGSSDGTKFPSYIKPNDTLLFFRKSMCRAKALVSFSSSLAESWPLFAFKVIVE